MRLEAAVKAFADLMVLTFVVSSMLGVGLSLTLSQIIAPLRRARLVVAALVANFVVAPLVVVGITKLIPLSEPLTVGLLLLGTAAGAPFLPKIVETAKGDLAFAVALMVLLLVGTLGYLPLMLPLLLPGVSVSSRKIAQALLVSMILPLIVGLFVKARRESLAAGLRPLMSRVSNASVIVALVLIPVMNYRSLLGIVGSGAILAGTLFVGVSFVAGFVLGGPMRESKMVLGFGTAGRNIPAAMLVASQNFDDPQVAVMIIVVVLLTLFILMPLAVWFGRRSQATEKLR